MTQNPPVKSARRATLALTAFLGVYFLTAVPTLVMFGFRGSTFLVPLVAAVVAARYVWTHAGDMPKYLAGFVFYGAVMFGSAGFAAGFFGPLTFAPEANQGPLLGIFTGPAGVLIGAIAGLVYGFMKSRER